MDARLNFCQLSAQFDSTIKHKYPRKIRPFKDAGSLNTYFYANAKRINNDAQTERA